MTAAAAVALARAYRPMLVLLGRSPAPEPEPDWLAPLQAEAEIKRALGTHLNGDATPRAIGEHYHQLTAQRETRRDPRAHRGGGRPGGVLLGGRARRRGDRRRAAPGACGAWAGARRDPRRRRAGRRLHRGQNGGAIRPRLRHEGRRTAQRPGGADVGGSAGAGAVLVVHRPLRPDGAGRLRHRQRGAEQDGPAARPPAAALPRRLGQLGAMGRRHGDAGAEERLRRGGHRPDRPRSGGRVSGSGVGAVRGPGRRDRGAGAWCGQTAPRLAGDSRSESPDHADRAASPSRSSACWTSRSIRCWSRTCWTVGRFCRWR